MRYTVRAPCTSLPKRNRWPSRLRVRYSDSSETGGQSVKVWGFGSHGKSPELLYTMRQTLKVLLISNVAAVYSFHSFNESISWGSQAITDWNIPLCILPALKAAKIAKLMALLDRRGRIWMIRDINFRVNFSPQFLVFTCFKRHLFCSVFLSIFMTLKCQK